MSIAAMAELQQKKDSIVIVLSPISLRYRPLDIPKGGAFVVYRRKKAEHFSFDSFIP